MVRYSKSLSVRRIDPQDLSWESLVDVFEDDLNESLKGLIQIQSRDKEGMPVKLHKELAMVRLILTAKLKTADKGEVALDSKFLVEMVKLLKRCEKLSNLYEINLDKWSFFILAVITKLKKEKLLAYKKKPVKDKMIWQKLKDADERHGTD